MSATALVKLTSKRLVPAAGVQCTSRRRRFGGSIAPLFGYASCGARPATAAPVKLVAGFAGSAGLTAGDESTADSFTVSDVRTFTGPFEFEAVASTVSLPPRCAGSVATTGSRVENVGPPFRGNPPTR